MKKSLNFGLVGYKFMGKAHSNALRKLPMFFDLPCDVNLHTICGRDEKWLSQSADKFGFSNYDTDWKNMVLNPEIDVVDITTPSNYHTEIALMAAENKKAIFCEKPLALNLKDAREMEAAAIKNGVANQIGFNYRFVPAVKLIKKLIDEGKLGKIYHFRGCYLQDFIMSPDFPKIWRLDKTVAGSGSHGDLGAHVVDMARYLVGEFDEVIGMSETFIKTRPVAQMMTGLSASGGESTKKEEIDVDDATIFLAKFACGALGTFEATRFSAGHKNDMYFEISGSRGAVKFVFERMNELQYFSFDDEADLQGFRTIQVSESVHPYMTHWWPAGHVIGYEHTFVHEFFEFTSSILNGTTPTPSFTDGVKCSQILEAVDKSIENRCFVKVQDL